MVGDAYIVDNMDRVADVWVSDCKGIESVKLRLDSNLHVFELWLVSIFSDQVCW